MTDTHPNIRYGNLDRIDRIWVLMLGSIGMVMCAILSDTIFEASIFFSGILCVGLIAIGRREGYLIGLYNSVAYAILAYNNGLFGEVYLNILFFLPTGVIGYLMWSHHTQERVVRMRSLSSRGRIIVTLMCLFCTLGLGRMLALNPGQNTPYVDAATNVLSILATFLMMWRYKEQWLLYIVLNLVTVVMWFFRALNNGEGGDLMVLMWTLFLANALFGYWRWHIGAGEEAMASVLAKEPLCAGD